MNCPVCNSAACKDVLLCLEEAKFNIEEAIQAEWKYGLTEDFLTKGMSCMVKGMVAQKMGDYSIAGCQTKISAQSVNFPARIAHVRGNDPINPTIIGIWVVPENTKDIKIFPGLEIEATHCKKCNIIEIGPFTPTMIKPRPPSSDTNLGIIAGQLMRKWFGDK